MSFRVEPGTITGFLGPNGAGKSTTLRSIARARPPRCGQHDRPRRAVPAARPAAPPRRRGARGERVHPGRSGRNHLRVQAAAAGLSTLAGRGGARARRAERGGEAARQGLLARDATAARPRHGAPRRPRGARARRAGERARPGRGSGGSATSCARSRPRAGRSSSRATCSPRSRRRPTCRDHPSRQADPAGDDRRGARGRRRAPRACGAPRRAATRASSPRQARPSPRSARRRSRSTSRRSGSARWPPRTGSSCTS